MISLDRSGVALLILIAGSLSATEDVFHLADRYFPGKGVRLGLDVIGPIPHPDLARRHHLISRPHLGPATFEGGGRLSGLGLGGLGALAVESLDGVLGVDSGAAEGGG